MNNDRQNESEQVFSNNSQFVHNDNMNLLESSKIPHWRIWLTSIAFIIFHLLVLNIGGILVGIIQIYASSAVTQEEIMNILMSSDLQNWACVFMFIICTPIYIIFLRIRNRKYHGSVSLKTVGFGSSLSMFFLIFGSLGMVTGLLTLLEVMGKYVHFIAKWIQDYIELTEMIVSDQGNMLLQIVATVIMVPIAEELLFRGIVLGELNLRYSPRVVVLVQAVLFAVFHMNPIQTLYTFIPGLLLGIAYYYTGNLVIPIIMHMIFNFIGGIANLILPEAVLSWLQYAELVVGIFSIIVVIRFFVKAKPDQEHKLQWKYNT